MVEPPTTDPGLPNPVSTQSFWHTPPSAFLHAHRTTTSLPTSVDTVIIGSGIAGAMLFHHLHTKSSSSMLMLEARNTCWGATGRNGGHCKPMLYQSGDFLDLCRIFGEDESLKRIKFEQLSLELIAGYISSARVSCEWQESPSADVYYEPAPFALAKQNIAALAVAAPEIARMLRVVETTAELCDLLRAPTAVGAVVFSAGKLSPYKLVAHILEAAVKADQLNLQTTTPALSIARAEDREKWLVDTPRGRVLTKRVVFATNAHTAHLLPVFRGWIYPVRAQMAALVPPKSLKDRPLIHTYGLIRGDRKTACYLIQRSVDEDGGGGELMLGGGREFEENKGIGLQDGRINPAVAHTLRTSVAGYFADETGYSGEEVVEENRELRKSFIEKFRRLRLGGVAGFDVWDAADGLGFDDDGADLEGAKSKECPTITTTTRTTKECKAKMEWSGTMGFSSDERPFVGKVPVVGGEDARRLGIAEMEYTKGLWILAGFEGHGMAFAPGSAKALAEMIEADEKGRDAESVYEWFPRTFEVTPARLGLAVGELDNWEEILPEDWELVECE